MISNARIGVKLHKNVTLDPHHRSGSCRGVAGPEDSGSLGGGQAVRYGASGRARRGRCRDRRASPHGPHAACRAVEGPFEMSAGSQSPPSQNRTEVQRPAARSHRAVDAEPRLAFRTALARYKGPRLAAIRLAQGAAPGDTRIRPTGNADEITEHLDQPAAVEALVARLDSGSRMALSLFNLIETTSIPLAGLMHALGILGADPIEALVKLLELGLLAIEPSAELGPVDDFRLILDRGSSSRLRLRAHPAVINGVRPCPRTSRRPPSRERSGRSANRMAWSRSSGCGASGSGWAPSRCARPTRERSTSATATGSPKTRCWRVRSPMRSCHWPDLPDLWLELAMQRRAYRTRPRWRPFTRGSRRILERQRGPPAPDDRHRPGWAWHHGKSWKHRPSTPARPARPCRSCASPLLLLLSALGESEWAPLDELASQLSARWPSWDRIIVHRAAGSLCRRPPAGPLLPPAAAEAGRPRAPVPRGLAVLETVLLGAAYPLGLVRAAEESGSGRRVVQLTASGTLCSGHGADAAAPPDLRSVHLRAAQLRGHRLSTGIDAPARGTAEPVRLVVADRGRTRAQAHSRVDRSRARLGIHARDDPGNLDEAQPEALAAGCDRRRQELGHSPRAGDLLRGRHVDRIRLVRRPRRGPGVLARRATAVAPIAVAERFLLVEDDRIRPV